MHLSIGWPQGIYLALQVLALIGTISRHGQWAQVKAGHRAFGLVFIILPLLYWGGFFGC